MLINLNIKLIHIAITNIFRHQAKTLAIAVPLIICIALAAAVTFVKDGLQKDAELAARMLPDITVQSMVAGRVERASYSWLNPLQATKNVRAVYPRVWGYLPIKMNSRDVVYSVLGLDPKVIRNRKNLNFALESGRFPEKTGSNEVVVGKTLAQALSLKINDEFLLTDWFGGKTKFKLIGIFQNSVEIYAADLILMDIETARKFFNYRADEASDFCVYLNQPGYADTVAAEINRQIPGVRVLTKDVLGDLTRQSYGGRAGVFGLMWLVILLTVILTAWAQGATVRFDAAREIGILKAIGWSTGDIIRVKLYEGFIIAASSTLLGLIIGLGYVLAGAPGIKAYFLGWSSVFPEFAIPLRITPAALVTLFIVGIFPLLFASIIPAWWAGIIEPDRTMRE